MWRSFFAWPLQRKIECSHLLVWASQSCTAV